MKSTQTPSKRSTEAQLPLRRFRINNHADRLHVSVIQYDLIMPDGKHRSVFESLQELGNERSGHFPNARLVRHEGFILSKLAYMYNVPPLKIIERMIFALISFQVINCIFSLGSLVRTFASAFNSAFCLAIKLNHWMF